jgi:hypothetical protein
MLNNIILKFILILFFNLTLALFADDESNNLENILEWEEVKFSKGYQVQIRNSNKKVLIDEKVNENKYKIKLPEGVYEERLGVYNKFGKISAFSEWEKIVVSKVFIPEVKIDNIELSSNPENHSLTIKGNNFSSDIKLFLKSKHDHNILKSFVVNNEKEIIINISINHNSIGKYDLVLVNPRNKKTHIPEFLSIIEKKEEIISSNQRAIEDETPIINSDKNNFISSSMRFNAGWRSALIPGWGQYYKEEKVKSIIYFTTFFSGLLYFNTLNQDYNQAKSKFENSSNLGLLIGTYQGSGAGGLVLYNYLQNESNYNDSVIKASKASQVAIGVELIYLVNLLDAIFFNSAPKQESTGFKIITDYKIQSFGPGLPLNSQYDLGIKWNF